MTPTFDTAQRWNKVPFLPSAAMLMAALASGAGAQPAGSGYGGQSFHEVNATVMPEEALRLGAPRSYRVYSRLRDPSDQLVLRERPIISSREIVEAACSIRSRAGLS
jgi:hypothetical protein